MTTDGVVGQRRGILRLCLNMTIGNKSQLDQCLETVTDTKYKSISLIDQLFNCFF